MAQTVNWDRVLAYLAVAVSLAVFIILRTPTTVSFALVFFFLALIHPALSIASWLRTKGWRVRGYVLVIVLACFVVVFGLFMWPAGDHSPTAREIAAEIVGLTNAVTSKKSSTGGSPALQRENTSSTATPVHDQKTGSASGRLQLFFARLITVKVTGLLSAAFSAVLLVTLMSVLVIRRYRTPRLSYIYASDARSCFVVERDGGYAEADVHTSSENTIQAVVGSFVNSSRNPIPMVRARIAYVQSGPTVVHTACGTWLNEKLDRTSFAPDETRDLLIALRCDSEMFTANDNRREPEAPSACSKRKLPFMNFLAYVNLSVLDSAGKLVGRSKRQVFSVGLNKKGPTIEVLWN